MINCQPNKKPLAPSLMVLYDYIQCYHIANLDSARINLQCLIKFNVIRLPIAYSASWSARILNIGHLTFLFRAIPLSCSPGCIKQIPNTNFDIQQIPYLTLPCINLPIPNLTIAFHRKKLATIEDSVAVLVQLKRFQRFNGISPRFEMMHLIPYVQMPAETTSKAQIIILIQHGLDI